MSVSSRSPTPRVALRSATPSDAGRVLDIYRPFVENTVVSFERVPPSDREMAERITVATSEWEWLVAEIDGRMVGYAYAGRHRGREAYRYSVETSVYVDPGFRRCGIARSLYVELFERLGTRGYASAYAGIAVPNDASVAFHESLGFEAVGIFPRVGRKFDAWHDVLWMYRNVGGQAG